MYTRARVRTRLIGYATLASLDDRGQKRYYARRGRCLYPAIRSIVVINDPGFFIGDRDTISYQLPRASERTRQDE